MDDISLKSEVASSWDIEADNYDTLISHGIQTDEEKELWKEVFKEALPVSECPLCILDVGCGTGAMGLILAEMGHTVIGLDLSENMMDVGRKKAKGMNLSMSFLNGDADDPPFEDNNFDCVITRHLLWTLPNPEKALHSWYRVIKPGGKVLVVDGIWDDGTLSTKVKKVFGETIAGIFGKKPHGKLKYSEDLNQSLPNRRGTSEENARKYFSEAGLGDLSIDNLHYIRENQKKQMEWYERSGVSWSYYLISGVKHE